MEHLQGVNWLDMSPQQIEAAQSEKRDKDKQQSKHILTSLNNLESTLLKCISSLSSAEKNLVNGGEECGAPFIKNIERYINGLSLIGNISSSLDNISFPIALCDYIDQGKNPDLQMKQNYNVTQSRNNLQRARIVNTHALEEYLKNGQLYFVNQWPAEKNQNEQTKNLKEQNDDDDDDIDIDLK